MEDEAEACVDPLHNESLRATIDDVAVGVEESKVPHPEGRPSDGVDAANKSGVGEVGDLLEATDVVVLCV